MVRLWQDRFEEKGRVYRSWLTDRSGEWRSRPGFVELIDNLVHARERTGNLVHIILAKAKDKDASSCSIERCFPQPGLKMRVTEPGQEAGTFDLERIEL